MFPADSHLTTRVTFTLVYPTSVQIPKILLNIQPTPNYAVAWMVWILLQISCSFNLFSNYSYDTVDGGILISSIGMNAWVCANVHPYGYIHVYDCALTMGMHMRMCMYRDSDMFA